MSPRENQCRPRQSKSESMVNWTRINSSQSIFIWNITHRQAISPVAKFHPVLGHDFMIQRVTLIFTKCLSANQNQLFYIKYIISAQQDYFHPFTHSIYFAPSKIPFKWFCFFIKNITRKTLPSLKFAHWRWGHKGRK